MDEDKMVKGSHASHGISDTCLGQLTVALSKGIGV